MGKKNNKFRDPTFFPCRGSLFVLLLSLLVQGGGEGIDPLQNRQVLHILHVHHKEAIQEVRTDPLTLLSRRLKQVNLSRAVQGLIRFSTTNVLLETRFDKIQRIAVPCDLMTKFGRELAGHGVFRWLDGWFVCRMGWAMASIFL